MAANRLFRNSAAFGKRIKYWIIGRMLKEVFNVYIPVVDDHAVDAIISDHAAFGGIALPLVFGPRVG